MLLLVVLIFASFSADYADASFMSQLEKFSSSIHDLGAIRLSVADEVVSIDMKSLPSDTARVEAIVDGQRLDAAIFDKSGSFTIARFVERPRHVFVVALDHKGKHVGFGYVAIAMNTEQKQEQEIKPKEEQEQEPKQQQQPAAATNKNWMAGFPYKGEHPLAWSDSVCGDSNWQQKYINLHKEIRSGQRPPKIVLFIPSAGIGNRLFGWASALAFAMTTERALMVEDPLLLNGLYESPFLDVFTDGALLDQARQEGGMREIGIFSKNADEKMEDIVKHGINYPESVIMLKTNTVLWPFLRKSHAHKAFWESLGLLHEDSFFGCAMQLLLRPTADMSLALQSIEEQMQGKYNIGLQVRVHPKSGSAPLSDVKYFVDCARHIREVHAPKNVPVQYVLVTDWLEGGELVAEAFDSMGESLLWPRPPPQMIIGEPIDMDTLIDHTVLSLCNETVISYASTFGLTASQLYPGVRAHHVYARHYQHPEAGRTCDRHRCTDADPCFNKPYAYFTSNKHPYAWTEIGGGFLQINKDNHIQDEMRQIELLEME